MIEGITLYKGYIIMGAGLLIFLVGIISIIQIYIKRIQAPVARNEEQGMEEGKKTFEHLNEGQNAYPEAIKSINENMSNFLMTYREKDKIIDEKNRSLYQLQEKISSIEKNRETSSREQNYDGDKELLLEDKRRIIETLQQRLQEVEHKFKRVILLHKTIAEKEQIKESMLEEKNTLITKLQYKLHDVEKKLELMTITNEHNKEKLMENRFSSIDKKIERENDKTQIFIILGILFVLILYLYTRP